MWHPEVLPAAWASVAVELDELGLAAEGYLAGGTALALRLGHRLSGDLDLMVPVPFSSEEIRARLAARTDVRHISAAEHALHAEIRGIPVNVLHYRHPLLFPPDPLGGLHVADARDVSCMILASVIKRGARRDFVDLYAAGQAFGLPSILEWLDRKFAAAPYARDRVRSALTQFAEAESEPMPDLLTLVTWEEVRRYVISGAQSLP
jgi:hypothetical protein